MKCVHLQMALPCPRTLLAPSPLTPLQVSVSSQPHQSSRLHLAVWREGNGPQIERVWGTTGNKAAAGIGASSSKCLQALRSAQTPAFSLFPVLTIFEHSRNNLEAILGCIRKMLASPGDSSLVDVLCSLKYLLLP